MKLIQKQQNSIKEQTQTRNDLSRYERVLYDDLESVWNKKQDIESFGTQVYNALLSSAITIANKYAHMVVDDVFFEEKMLDAIGITKEQWYEITEAWNKDFIPAKLEFECNLMQETTNKYIQEQTLDKIFSDVRRMAISISICTDVRNLGSSAIIPCFDSLTMAFIEKNKSRKGTR